MPAYPDAKRHVYNFLFTAASLVSCFRLKLMKILRENEELIFRRKIAKQFSPLFNRIRIKTNYLCSTNFRLLNIDSKFLIFT